MTKWTIRRVFVPMGEPETSMSALDVELADGYEPFAATPHVFMGETTGHTVWLRKEKGGE